MQGSPGRIALSAVTLAYPSGSDAPPSGEEERLHHSLRQLYPEKERPPVQVGASWCSGSGSWRIHYASQPRAPGAYNDLTRELVERLRHLGHAVQPMGGPLDSPPSGVLLPMPRKP